MIYTLTVNPALDYILKTGEFRLHGTMRADEAYLLTGGKGINVSRVLKNIGTESIALGFTAGFTGKELQARLHKDGIIGDFTELPEGMTRINVKMESFQGTEINAPGPEADEGSIRTLLEKIGKLTENDTLVLSGSILKNMEKDFYAKVLDSLKGKNIRTVVDASGGLLLKALPKRPYLVKPNLDELSELVHREIRTKEDALTYAGQMLETGARNVLVSMGGDGAVFASDSGERFRCGAPEGEVKNAVGAGDSMVAGFLYGMEKTESLKEAFRYAVAAGSASAFSDTYAKKEEVEKVYADIRVETV